MSPAAKNKIQRVSKEIRLPERKVIQAKLI